MALRGLFNSTCLGYIGEYKLYIRSDDTEQAPHFHLNDDSGQWSWCIRLDRAEYLPKCCSPKSLNEYEKTQLMNFFRDCSYEAKSLGCSNNWRYACTVWESGNGTRIRALVIPNYLKLTDEDDNMEVLR